MIVQKSEYILSGGTDEIKPMFSWRCYRYLSAESDGNFEICTSLKKAETIFAIGGGSNAARRAFDGAVKDW